MKRVKTLDKLRDEFAVLQRSTRDFADVGQWFINNAELLRAASKQLGHEPRRTYIDYMGMEREEPFMRKAYVRCFSIAEEEGVTTGHQRAYLLDPLSQYVQVSVTCTYETDPSINIKMITQAIPEMGLWIEPGTSDVEVSGGWNKKTFFFSPSRWPLAASKILLNLNYDEPASIRCAQQVLSTVFPATPWPVFNTLFDADVFESASVLYDLLMRNEEQSKVLNIPCDAFDLPTNFQ